MDPLTLKLARRFALEAKGTTLAPATPNLLDAEQVTFQALPMSAAGVSLEAVTLPSGRRGLRVRSTTENAVARVEWRVPVAGLKSGSWSAGVAS